MTNQVEDRVFVHDNLSVLNISYDDHLRFQEQEYAYTGFNVPNRRIPLIHKKIKILFGDKGTFTNIDKPRINLLELGARGGNNAHLISGMIPQIAPECTTLNYLGIDLDPSNTKLYDTDAFLKLPNKTNLTLHSGRDIMETFREHKEKLDVIVAIAQDPLFEIPGFADEFLSFIDANLQPNGVVIFYGWDEEYTTSIEKLGLYVNKGPLEFSMLIAQRN